MPPKMMLRPNHIDPMPPFSLSPIKLALLLCISAPLLGQANDITISSTFMAPDAAIDPAFGGDTNNPESAATQVLEMEEVDVWARIRTGFSIQDLDSPLVASQAARYSANPEYFLRTTNRASRYLFHVVQELDKRGMPTELALLPFVESAFNPEGMFGDWQLALAAYNWGEGSVQRAMKKNEAAGKPTDFNSLSPLMPAETRNYVPKLLAIKSIIANPAQFGINLPKVENQPYFVTINKTRNIDVKIAAQLAELPITEFKALNPQFNRPIIIGGEKTRILLPHDNAEKFKTNLAKWQRPLSTWTSITVSTRERRIMIKVGKRDSLSSIADRYQVSIAQLKDWNNLSRDQLKFGQRLRLQVPFSSRAGRSSHRVKAASKKRNR